MIQKNLIKCPYCSSENTKKEGKRKNRLQIIQKCKCKDCGKAFALSPLKGKSYPIKAMLNSILHYNLGCTQKEVSRIIAQKHKLQVPQKTISNWINEYKHLCAFSRLREQALKQYNYNPKTIIHKQVLNHVQPYIFRYHKAKLAILIKENPQFAKLREYIEKIDSKEFPHHIFTYNKEQNQNSQRASQLKFNHLNIRIISKTNQC